MQVPLKRVNQAYVIATSTKADIEGVDISKFNDSYFKAAEKPREKKGEEEFFKAADSEEKKVRNFSIAWQKHEYWLAIFVKRPLRCRRSDYSFVEQHQQQSAEWTGLA